jgi:hypothetical protein
VNDLPDLSHLTPKQAEFTEGIISGMNNVEAYEHAGYSQNHPTKELAREASKLKRNPRIAPILTAFQLRQAAKLAKTADGHTQQLLDLARKSEDAENYGAAIRAVELTGKVAGHYVDRVAIEQAPPVENALQVVCQELADTLGDDIARKYAAAKGVEWLPQGDTEVHELEDLTDQDEA